MYKRDEQTMSSMKYELIRYLPKLKKLLPKYLKAKLGSTDSLAAIEIEPADFKNIKPISASIINKISKFAELNNLGIMDIGKNTGIVLYLKWSRYAY